MSFESQIRTLTDAINNLAFIMQQQAVLQPAAAAAPVIEIIPEPEPRPIPIVEVFPVAAPVAEIVAAPAPASTGMPAPPFTVAAPAQPKAPFTDTKGLMDYMMTAWQTLGPVKGAGIQEVMTKLGHKNVSDIAASDYDALFAGVEALK